MLKDQPWILFAPEMLLEWKQARDEGRDVRLYRPLCEEIAKRSKIENKEEMARSLKTQLDNAPMCQLQEINKRFDTVIFCIFFMHKYNNYGLLAIYSLAHWHIV